MKKFKLKLFILTNFIVITLIGCSNLQDNPKLNSESNLKSELTVDNDKILRTIKDITVQTREFGSDGEKQISENIKSTLESYGYNVQFQDFKVFDVGNDVRDYINSDDINTFLNTNPTNSTNPKGIARNIIIKSKDFDSTKKTLYLSAHYDTTKRTTGVYDNATGVSALIEIARNLKSYKNNEFNIVYTVFSAEEYFKIGSRYYLSQLSDSEKGNIIGAINIDMIGYKGFEYTGWPTVGDIEIILMPDTTNNPLKDSFNSMFNNKYNINYEMGGMSDDISFAKLGIPTIYFADENFSTGFEIEEKSTELQLEPLNVVSISNLCTDIIVFIKNANIDNLT